jgi:hypothetical protein
MAWPPELEDLKEDLKIEETDIRDDERLTVVLNAAVAFVERMRPTFNYEDVPTSDLEDPTDDLFLGTIRLAGRWHTRRRSPDGLIQMAELGASRVPSFDPDIERLLGIGRFAKSVIA